jgi:glycosyltransferase involved in cell wall biosynthesis
MSGRPILTIITPVYNGERYIAETIESVLNAKIDISYEYIVLDDGSTDLTANILSYYRGSIKIFSHSNMGESATVNRGIENAKGNYILIINADDPLLTKDLINKAYEILINDSSVVAIYPDWKIINKYGKTIRNRILPNYSDELLIGHCRCLPGPGTIFRRDAALKIGGRRLNWKFVSDYDFWLRLSRVGKVVRLPEILAQWRENPNSTSIANRGIEMATERIEVTEAFLYENQVPVKLRQMALGNCHYLAARLAFFDHKVNGRALLLKAFKYRCGWPETAKLHVVLYLLLMPISSIILKPLSKLIVKIVSYK